MDPMNWLADRRRLPFLAVPLAGLILIASLSRCGSKGSPGAEDQGAVPGPGATAASGAPSSDAQDRIRLPALAGSWYPAEPIELENQLGLYLDRTGRVETRERVLALIAPHAGHVFSGQAAAYAYQALAGRDVRRVIVLGVSHAFPLRGAALPDATHFKTPLGLIPVDTRALAALSGSPLFAVRPEVHEREHSIEIQLPFVQKVLPEGYAIVPVLFGVLKGEEYAAAAAALRKLVDDKTVIVASSDFMHYGERFNYRPFSKDVPRGIAAFDRKSIDRILSRDPKGFLAAQKQTGNTVCGETPIAVLLNALPERARGNLLRYYRSGDITGEWEGSVSYASILFTDGSAPGEPAVAVSGSEAETREADMLGPEEQRQLVTLARDTVDAFVNKGIVPDPRVLANTVKKGLLKTRGVFVTLRRQRELRGCIGSIVGAAPLYQGVIENAVNASANDRRFPPVQPAELSEVSVEVSVLGPLRAVSGPDQILVGWHGVLLTKGDRQAVFLPQVPLEFGWTRDQMLSQLSRKAGLEEDGWRSGATYQVFEAQIIPEGI